MWDVLLDFLIHQGKPSAPRGKPIREQLNVTLHVERARYNVLVNPGRNLGYRAMVAEWLWIAGGYGDVESISRYNARMREFSDDSLHLYGAYGPRIMKNWSTVRDQLNDDRDTRQAILPIWDLDIDRTSKDVPCTLSLQFLYRLGALHLTVNMRSSDIWLGLPFDFYVFSQLLNEMACETDTAVGSLTMNLGSSHLYDVNYEAAIEASKSRSYTVKTPQFHDLGFLGELYDRFEDVSGETVSVGGQTIWDLYAKILVAPTRLAALDLLKKIGEMQDA